MAFSRKKRANASWRMGSGDRKMTYTDGKIGSVLGPYRQHVLDVVRTCLKRGIRHNLGDNRRLHVILTCFQCQPEWRNWQTRQVEGLVPVIGSAGSIPVSGTDTTRTYGEKPRVLCRFTTSSLGPFWGRYTSRLAFKPSRKHGIDSAFTLRTPGRPGREPSASFATKLGSS